MNNAKTEIIAYGTKQHLEKVNITSVIVGGCEVNVCGQCSRPWGANVKNLKF